LIIPEERFERELAVEQDAAEEEAKTRAALQPMRAFEEVALFVSYFLAGVLRMRRPILAIIGGTNLGKSLLAAAVVRRVGELIGVAGVHEITVEEQENFDLSDYNRREHAGVILDGVADAMILKMNRESLQGRPKVCKGARSATNVYSYKYSFTGRAVVATFDLSANNLSAFDTDHWLSNPLNVIVLKLNGRKAYIENEVVQPAPQTVTGSSPERLPPTKRRVTGSPTVPQMPS